MLGLGRGLGVPGATGRRLARLQHQIIACSTTSSSASSPPGQTQSDDQKEATLLRLTSGSGPLTFAQREQYERDGFVVVPQLFSEEEVAAFRQHYFEICREPERWVMKRTGVLVRDKTVVDGVLDRSQLGQEFSVIKMFSFRGTEGEDRLFVEGFARAPKLLNLVRQFIGRGEPDNRSITTANHMYVAKPPGLGDEGSLSSRHPLHQDNFYFPTGRRDPQTGSLAAEDRDYCVCAWLACGDVNRRNGCLSLVPGTHWAGLRPHGYPDVAEWKARNNAAYYGIVDLSQEEIDKRVHCEMKQGDVVFFHPELIHGSGLNSCRLEEAATDPFAFRHAISVHYRRKDAAFVDISGGKGSVPPGKSLSSWDEGEKPENLTAFLRSPIARAKKLNTVEQARRWMAENHEELVRLRHEGNRAMQIDADTPTEKKYPTSF